MTENKRFTLAYEKGNWWAVRDGDITLWKEEVIHTLNALHEENEQLRKINIRWGNQNEELEKENKELRKYLSWQDMELEEMEDLE